MPRRRPVVALFVALVCLSSTSSSALAQPLADRVRSDAVIYFGWGGASQIGSGYEGSHLKAVVEESNFRQVFGDFLPRVLARVEQENGGETAVFRQVLTEVAAPMWRHPTAFYFGGVQVKAEAQPMPRLALVTQAGSDAPAMFKRLSELLRQVPKEAPVRAAQVDDVVVISVGFEKAEMALAGAKGGSGSSLAQDQGYRAALASVHPQSHAALYVDVSRMLKNADESFAAYGGPEAKDKWTRALGVSGLAGLRRIIVTETFEGRDWSTRAFMDAPAPRKGLLTALDVKPVSDAALNVIPKNSTLAGVFRVDIGKLFATIRAGVAQFDANAGRQIDDGLEQVRGTFGVDVQKDLLEPFGDEWAYYTDPTGGGKGFVGFTLVNRLRDPKKAEASLIRVQAVLNMVMQQQLREAEVKVAFKQTQVKGVNIRYLAVPLVSPGWAVADGNLYVGLFPETVAAAAEHVRSKSPSILQNEAFAAARKQLGGSRAAGIQFIDLPRTAQDAYPGWLMVSRLVGIGDLFGVDAPAIVGPPLKTLMANLTPAVTVEWSDDKGWYGHSRVPFPGSTLLTSDPLGGGFNTLPTIMELFKQMQ